MPHISPAAAAALAVCSADSCNIILKSSLKPVPFGLQGIQLVKRLRLLDCCFQVKVLETLRVLPAILRHLTKQHSSHYLKRLYFCITWAAVC